MKKLKQYISITSIAILTFGLANCKVSDFFKNKNTELTKENSSDDLIGEVDFKLPNGYVLFDKINGDLNGDGLDDHILVIKGTNKKNIVVDRSDKEVDRNRRGILIYLSENNKTFLATKNLNCFLSENEDGGIYYPPYFSIKIENEKLFLHYEHGRYGYWEYIFKYQNAAFELIAYNSSSNFGQIINQEINIDFLTKKKLVRKNINPDTENSGDEIFEDNWEEIDVEQLLKLSEVTDFDELNLNRGN